jgi:hypothetical protein
MYGLLLPLVYHAVYVSAGCLRIRTYLGGYCINNRQRTVLAPPEATRPTLFLLCVTSNLPQSTVQYTRPFLLHMAL